MIVGSKNKKEEKQRDESFAAKTIVGCSQQVAQTFFVMPTTIVFPTTNSIIVHITRQENPVDKQANDTLCTLQGQ